MARIADVDIRLLRVFLAVVESGGFSAAQTVLNVGIPTISLHMSELERRIGFRLCSRGSAGFQLSDRGKEVYEQTRALVATLDDYFGNITALKGYLAGPIRLGIVDGLVTHPKCRVVPAIQAFNAADHQVEIELVVDERTELERQVLSGQLHAAIGPKVRGIAGLKFVPLFKETHRLYCGKSHPLFDPSSSRLPEKALEGLNFVVRRYNEFFDTKHLIAASRGARVNTMEGMLVLLLTGDYVGYLPDHFAAPWEQSGQLCRVNVADTAYQSQHCLVTNNAVKHSLAVDRLIKILLGSEVSIAPRQGLGRTEPSKRELRGRRASLRPPPASPP